MDAITVILAMAIIILTIIVVFNGSRVILAIVFYIGTAMFLMRIIRGLYVRDYIKAILIFPAAACIVAGLIAENILSLPHI